MRLYALYGSEADAMANRLMRECFDSGLPKTAKIGIKPNLVVARSFETGATTNPLTVRGVLEYLRDEGYANIVLIEGSWVGDSTQKAFTVCGYAELCKRFGVKIVDTKRDSYERRTACGYTMEISKTALDLDYIINMPVIKGHCQTKLTCALKNMKGVLSDGEKRRFHAQGLHGPIAALNVLIRPHLTIADGIIGDIDFEEGGNPVRMNTMLAGRDPVLLDSYAATLLGYQPQEIGYIPLAAAAGVGSMDISPSNVMQMNTGGGVGAIPKSRIVDALKRHANEKDACSACYGSLMRALHNIGSYHGEPICIGQGYRGQSGSLGVGKCTSGFDKNCPGCPPRAADIVRFLRG